MAKMNIVDVELFELKASIMEESFNVSPDLAMDASKLEYDQILNPKTITDKSLRDIVITRAKMQGFFDLSENDEIVVSRRADNNGKYPQERG